MSSAFWVPLLPSTATIVALPPVTEASHLAILLASVLSPILVSCWWITNLHSIYWLKTMYYLIVSVGQESGHSLCGSPASGDPTKLQPSCDPGQRSQLRIRLGRAHMIKFSSSGADGQRVSVLGGCWPEATLICPSLSHGLLQHGFLLHQSV